MHLFGNVNMVLNNCESVLSDIIILNTKGDGHCLLQGVYKSWTIHLHHLKDLELHSLKCAIFVEAIINIDRYIVFCEPPQNTNYHFFKDLQRYLLHKQYNSRVVDIVPLMTANALRIQLDIINEISPNNIYTTSLVPSGEYRGNLMLHLHKDHFSSVICKGRQPTSHGVTKYSECLTYTSNCLRSFRVGKHYRVSHKVRKTLFHLHIWQPTDILAGNDCNEGVQLSDIDQLEKPTKADHSNLIHIPLVEQQKLCNVNLTLLNPRSINNKATLLCEYIEANSIDLFAITETWEKSENRIASQEICPSGYKYIGIPRTDARGGVLDLYIETALTSSLISLKMYIINHLNIWPLAS